MYSIKHATYTRDYDLPFLLVMDLEREGISLDHEITWDGEGLGKTVAEYVESV